MVAARETPQKNLPEVGYTRKKGGVDYCKIIACNHLENTSSVVLLYVPGSTAAAVRVLLVL